MKLILTIAAYIGAAGVVGAAARRWVLRPLRVAVDALRGYIADVNEARAVNRELAQLAGSTVRLAVVLLGELEAANSRLDDISELTVDLNAEVFRIRRDLAELQMTA